jgi:hypothetical protein
MDDKKPVKCGAMKVVTHEGKTKQNGFINTPDGKSYWITIYKSDSPERAWPYTVYLKEKEVYKKENTIETKRENDDIAF